MAVQKQVKEYTNRQRINLNKADGFNPDDIVYVLSDKEYYGLINEVENLKNQTSETNATVDLTLKEIYKQHEKEIDKRENTIKQLTDELNSIRGAITSFITSIAGLSAIDVIFRSRHKELVNDFKESIWINRKDVEIVGSDNDRKLE